MQIGSGKCPSCGKIPHRVLIQSVDIGTITESHYKGVMYVCPNIQCQSILGVSIDPIALKADTISQVAKKLRGA